MSISELQLLRGNPVDIGECKVYPLTVGEIVELEEANYNKLISVLMISKDDMDKKNINPEFYAEFLKMDNFDYLLVLAHQTEEVREALLTSLSLFLREQVFFNSQYGLFIQREDGILLISKDIFNKIKETVSEQNFLKKGKPQKEEFNPHDDKVRELIEKRNKYKQLMQEQGEGLSLSDVVSIVACYCPNVNFFNVWNLTVYHLYTIYLRLVTKDQYDTHIHLLPHTSGDASKDIQHWLSKLNKQNN